MSDKKLETELSALQAVVAELQQRVTALEGKPKDNWLPAILGSFAGDEEFAQAMEDAKSFRLTGGFPDDEYEVPS